MKLEEMIAELETNSDPKNIEGMVRFGITPDRTYGSRVPLMRKLAKKAGKDHDLAKELWNHGFRETKIIASMVEEVDRVSDDQVEMWLADFDYWEIVDQFCMNLFTRFPDAADRAKDWTKREGEFEKRAGFALIACLVWKKKDMPDPDVLEFLPYIMDGATDGRNNVKKGVSWALRHIGKKNMTLNKEAVALAREIEQMDSKAAKWVGKDVLKELTDPKQLDRIKQRS